MDDFYLIKYLVLVEWISENQVQIWQPISSFLSFLDLT